MGNKLQTGCKLIIKALQEIHQDFPHFFLSEISFFACTIFFPGQGLSMSGADQKEAQDQLISGMKSKYPQCSQNVYIASDTAGAIATATEKGTV